MRRLNLKSFEFIFENIPDYLLILCMIFKYFGSGRCSPTKFDVIPGIYQGVGR